MRPPRGVRLWVRLIAPRELRDSLLDDLQESLQDEADARPPSAVRRRLRYWYEALRATPHLLRLRAISAGPRRAGWRTWLDQLRHDVRYGGRGLRRRPGFALTAMLTLAIGVATTTSVFSVADAELWKPLPYPDPDRLVAVYTRAPGEDANIDPLSGGDLQDWRAALPAFSHLAAERATSRRTLLADTAQSVLVAEVTANFFETLGMRVVAGRAPAAADLRGQAAAMLTEDGWRRLFAADSSVVGRPLTLDGESVVITGVLGVDDWLGGPNRDLFLAIDERAPEFLDRARSMFHWGAIGRLRPGVDAEVATAQLQAFVTRPEARSDGLPRLAFVEDLREFYAGGNWRPLYFFLGASFVVLLLSSVNVATLLLGRAFGRTREFALRGALGGGQAAFARQLLVEGVLLAVPAVALAIVLTQWVIGLFVSQLSGNFFYRGGSIAVDVRVAAFAIAITGLTTVVFALAPLLVSRRLDLAAALGAGTRAGRPVEERRARGVLLTVQIAVTVVLLAGAGIFLKSFVALLHVPLGFDPANAYAVRANPTGPRYASDAAVLAYADRLLETARTVPGVREAALGSSSPLGSGPIVEVAPEERPSASGRTTVDAIVRAVTPGYFQTLRIDVRRGRAFSPEDVAGAPRVAVVNESLARQAFGDADPIGRVLELHPARAPWTNRPGALLVVGVVANVKDVGINEIAFGNLYVPFAQLPAAGLELVVRADAPATGLGDALRRAIAHVDPTVPVGTVTVFAQRVDNALRGDRFNVLLISSFAAVALVLAAIGVYGAVSSHVQARTRELGVQLALGAPPRRLVGAALWTGGRVGLVGGVVGLLATLAIAAAVGDALYLVPGEHNGMLYRVSTTDPAMLTAAVAGVILVALVAGLLPARRILRVDPVQALRADQ